MSSLSKVRNGSACQPRSACQAVVGAPSNANDLAWAHEGWGKAKDY